MKNMIFLLLMAMFVGFTSNQSFAQYDATFELTYENNGRVSVWLVPQFTNSISSNFGNQVTTIAPIGATDPTDIVNHYGIWSFSSPVGNNGTEEFVVFGQNSSTPFTNVVNGLPKLLFEFDIECNGGEVRLMEDTDQVPNDGYNYGNVYQVIGQAPFFAGNVYNGNSGGPVSCSTLPIIFVSFSAEQIDCGQVKLQWEAYSDHLENSFMLERAVGTDMEFELVSIIKGKIEDTGVILYTYLDEDVPDDVRENRIYYRLRQIDGNGYRNLSEILTIAYSCEEDMLIEVYPNPLREILNIRSYNLSLKADEMVSVELLDSSGKRYDLQQFTASQFSEFMQIPLSSNIPGGNYLCRIKAGEKVISVHHISLVR